MVVVVVVVVVVGSIAFVKSIQIAWADEENTELTSSLPLTEVEVETQSLSSLNMVKLALLLLNSYGTFVK